MPYESRRMTAVEIETAVSDLMFQPFDKGEFPFAFLAAFSNKDTTLKRLHGIAAIGASINNLRSNRKPKQQ